MHGPPPDPQTKVLESTNTSMVLRVSSPGLSPLAPHTCVCTHAHHALHTDVLTLTHTPMSPEHMEGTVCVDPRRAELRDEVMLGRPTRACGETHYTWGISPFPHRALTSRSPPPHILLWSLLRTWEALRQMGFRLVTVSLVRSDYVHSISGSERPTVAWCSLGWPMTFQTQADPKTGKERCSFAALSKE